MHIGILFKMKFMYHVRGRIVGIRRRTLTFQLNFNSETSFFLKKKNVCGICQHTFLKKISIAGI